MRAPLSWLLTLAPLPATAGDAASVARLSSELDSLGLVVESVERVGEGLSGVVLSEVKEVASIPGADRIRRVVVDAGGPDEVEVVCGAWNFSAGDVVPLAPVGAELPGGFRIGRRKMKGVTSNGMLCSGRELGLSEDGEGILVLGRRGEAGLEPGLPLSEHLGIEPDVVFDLAIEANRPDCLCMLGVARDLAARLDLPLWVPDPKVAESGVPAAELASVRVDSPELCGRLAGRVLTGLSVGPSPAAVKRRLTLAGMRPIDSVVDASNYVMLELGQPTHPYDLSTLGGRGLVARAARPGERLVTLDGEERLLGTRSERDGDPLTALDCLICNAEDLPVGIGGVMGARLSEITPATGSVLLEVAQFLPVAIGRTARHLGLRTEASVRFERGVDPEGVERAALRVCELVVSAAVSAGLPPPVVAPGIVDDHPVRVGLGRLSVRVDQVNGLLGTGLSAAETTDLLEPIGYEVSVEPAVPGPAPGAGGSPGPAEVPEPAGGVLSLVVPSFRPDVVSEVDVIEDVARTYGYAKIARRQRRSPYVGRLDDRQVLRRRVRRVLAGLGAHEAWTSSIVDPEVVARTGYEGELVELSNPMAEEQSALRPGLLAGLLEALSHNSGHRHSYLRLFEVGDVFVPAEKAGGGRGPGEGTAPPGEATGRDHAIGEQERLGLLLARKSDGAAAAVQAWRVLSDTLGLADVSLLNLGEGSPLPGLHPMRTAVLSAPGAAPESTGRDRGATHDPALCIGTVGEVDPAVIAAFGLPHERIGWLDVDLGRLAAAPRRPAIARPVSRYPSSDVDLSFVVPDTVPAGAVGSVLRGAATEVCESVELFDVYRDPAAESPAAEGSRSLAFRLRFCAPDRTLTDSELARLRQGCIEAVEKALPATIRS